MNFSVRTVPTTPFLRDVVVLTRGQSCDFCRQLELKSCRCRNVVCSDCERTPACGKDVVLCEMCIFGYECEDCDTCEECKIPEYFASFKETLEGLFLHGVSRGVEYFDE
mmetsp:Transcript_11261/g.20443  ORF Transcript_11261/g.20443 Transcript_11261/m.20443 type:complete len:109 (+) Transcript_11261:423-749(+)